MMLFVLPTLVLLCISLCDVNAVKRCRKVKKEGLADATAQCGVKFHKGVSAKCGNKLLFGLTGTEPTIKFKLPKRNCKNATIISTDPDAFDVVGPPFLHELATNIPKKCLQKGYKSTTCKAGDLQAPFAVPGSPNHRYLFCVYCQNEYIEPHHYGPLSSYRMRFNKEEYARNHSLSIKACNFFRL
ncbi:uncharacterized protein LOC129235147 isoform X2 [Uloborus diversus]|uniref:uncharacterized protein LOC129235147 isoform X2 n=1 Tax=Uloborus diversus TaxID=327109 RepID=UPI002408FED3|nr:uncharacterized protein LOC129235147 isoform X2 [Uloborus diversus]